VEPVLLDAHNLDGEITMIAAFAGNHEDVDAQVNIARRMGFNAGRDTSYPARFWSEQQTQKLSVLPSKCVEEIQAIKAEQWIAHLGIGIIYFRGGIQYKNSKPDAHYRFEPLLREAYDPKGIFGNFHTA
jgi:hypothetical protein